MLEFLVMEPPNPGAPWEFNPNETVLCRSHFHWINLFWPAVFASLFLVPGVAALIGVFAPGGSSGGTLILETVGVFFLTIAAAVGFINYLRWKSREVVLTNKHLICISGTIRTEMTAIDVDQVESATLRTSLSGKILGYGTVVLNQVNAPRKFMGKIPHPENFYRYLQARRGERKVGTPNDSADAKSRS